jgi:hypothetical protein
MKRTRRKSERRYLLEVLVFFILGLILGHFAGKERDAARRDCEARGGELVVNRTQHHCELPDRPAAP